MKSFEGRNIPFNELRTEDSLTDESDSDDCDSDDSDSEGYSISPVVFPQGRTSSKKRKRSPNKAQSKLDFRIQTSKEYEHSDRPYGGSLLH